LWRSAGSGAEESAAVEQRWAAVGSSLTAEMNGSVKLAEAVLIALDRESALDRLLH
jgi:hypothetical protein